LRRTSKYASLLRISGALHLGIFEQSEKNDFFSKLLEQKWFDKKNSKWLKSSKIRGNLNSKGGSVHGKTG